MSDDTTDREYAGPGPAESLDMNPTARELFADGGRDHPPRPGDPDGTLFDRAVFWAGFFIWLAVMLVGWTLLSVYHAIHDAVATLRRWWP